MKLRTYFWVWVGVVLVLTYEWLMLNGPQPEEGLLGLLRQLWPAARSWNLSPEAGYPISLVLGWLGIGFMLVTNFYVVRKRLGWFKNWGRTAGWMDFHILCGLLGPTFIVFHTNFKVRGLVAISFWSMVIVFLSGVVGRYFYVQLLQNRKELDALVQAADDQFREMVKSVTGSDQPQLVGGVQLAALSRAGATWMQGRAATLPFGLGVLVALVATIVGDLRLMLALPATVPNLPGQSRQVLKKWSVGRRRVLFYDEFQKIMGYWHAFHLPFAVFMYAVAVIHIATALLFGIKR